MSSAEFATAKRSTLIPAIHLCNHEKLSIQVHSEENIFERLQTEWEELARVSDQTICMSSGWASKWWKHFGRHKNRSLFIITVYDDQRLVAIFPLYKGVTSVFGTCIQRRLQLIGSGGNTNENTGFSDDYGISDFLDIIVDPEYRLAVAHLLVNLIESAEYSDYCITFHQVRDDSFLMESVYPLLKVTSRNVKRELTDVCYYIKVDQNEDLKGFIKRSKSNARRRFRQTLRAIGIEKDFIIEEPDGPKAVECMLDTLIQLHQDRWNAIGFPGAFYDERFVAFFKELAMSAYQEDLLWIRQAVDERGVSSVRMLLKYNGRYYDYMSGYDNKSPSSRRRPGIGLLLDLVKHAHSEPIDRIELLRGDEAYKHDFTDLTVNNWKISIPEHSDWRTVWGVPVAMVRLISWLFKHAYREKILLSVQYQQIGFPSMLAGYFSLRWDRMSRKWRQLKGNE